MLAAALRTPGIRQDHGGLLELDAGAPVGADVRSLLQLEDQQAVSSINVAQRLIDIQRALNERTLLRQGASPDEIRALADGVDQRCLVVQLRAQLVFGRLGRLGRRRRSGWRER